MGSIQSFPQFQVLENADLGFSGSTVHTGLPLTGSFFTIGPYTKFQLGARVVVTGGDRAAGTVKFTLELYDSSQSGFLIASYDAMLGVQRFGAGTTKKGVVSFGGALAAVGLGDGTVTAGASINFLRAAAVGRLLVAQDAAYSGGTTDPTNAALTVWLSMAQ